MARELMDADVRRQAAACRDYVRRGGDMWLWFESKRFGREDRAAVLSEINRQMRAAGDGWRV